MGLKCLLGLGTEHNNGDAGEMRTYAGTPQWISSSFPLVLSVRGNSEDFSSPRRQNIGKMPREA